jgi:hypothetical protein
VSGDLDSDHEGDLETLDVTPPDASTRKVVTPRRLPRPSRLLPPVLAIAVIGAIVVSGVQDRQPLARRTTPLPTMQSTATTASTLPKLVAVERELRPGEQKCPADRAFADSLAHASIADMTRRGAADTLPEYGATTLDRVVAAARETDARIRKSQRDVIAVTVGRGVGWTFSQRSDLSIVYHRVDDFQVVVHLGTKDACPEVPSFVSNDRDQRVPSLYVYPAHP